MRGRATRELERLRVEKAVGGDDMNVEGVGSAGELDAFEAGVRDEAGRAWW
jgi:hypothetical protein